MSQQVYGWNGSQSAFGNELRIKTNHRGTELELLDVDGNFNLFQVKRTEQIFTKLFIRNCCRYSLANAFVMFRSLRETRDYNKKKS